MGILRTDFSSFLLKINCLRRNINWILVDTRCAILVDIGFREIDGNRLREIYFVK